MKYLRFIFFPFSLIYWCITGLRNKFYDWGIMKSSKFSVATINVGNLSMGGTGKSPHIEYLIRLLKDTNKVATLSRGFGRTERGFILADETATARSIGDEPLQFYTKYGEDIKVAVEADRVLGAMDLFRIHPEIDTLLLDDAYQHRAIHAGLNILLTDYNAPFYKDFILPVGNLREVKSGKNRADIIIVTKCPELSNTEKKVIISKLKLNDNQDVFFSKIKYGALFDLKTKKPLQLASQPVILVTGIANPSPLIDFIKTNSTILHHFKFNDHHKFSLKELEGIHDIFNKFTAQNPLIITTEKDAMRLMAKDFEAEIATYPWCYQSIEVELDRSAEFDKRIQAYVKNHH